MCCTNDTLNGRHAWHWRDPRYARLKCLLRQGHGHSGKEEIHNSQTTKMLPQSSRQVKRVYSYLFSMAGLLATKSKKLVAWVIAKRALAS